MKQFRPEKFNEADLTDPSPEELAPEMDADQPHFRTHKRSQMENLRFHIKRWLANFELVQLLPITIILAGSLVSAVFAGDGLSVAIITATTGILCVLSVFVRYALGLNQSPSSRKTLNRFEKLEDRAWELQESEERYRAIASVFGDALVMRDENGSITFCNDAFRSLAGFGGETLVQDTKIPKALQDQLNGLTGIAGNKEIEVQTEDDIRWFEWHDLPVRSEKTGGMGVLSIARDITAFRQTRQLDEEARKKAEDASRAKSRFLAMVSHEMRTPLNGIIGMSKLLSSTKLSPEQSNYSNALMTSGENLLGLIDGMLDLTMIEAGHFEIKKQEFQLHDLLNNAVELVSHRAYAKGIDCGLFLDPFVPNNIIMDPGRLRQIIFNLAGNAVKFTNKGGVLIRCVMANSDAPQVLRFEIIDTGPGLSPQDREKIFEEFERVDNEITRTTEGAGLGLAISRALAREMGGALYLEKSDASGSRFVFEVPFEEGHNQTSSSNFMHKTKKQLSNHQYLIISKMVQEPKALAETLVTEGASVETIQTGRGLRDLSSERIGQFDGIFFDPVNWDDPVKTLQLLKRNKAISARLIVLSQPEKKRELKNYQTNGADAWLVRPVRRSSLMALLLPEIENTSAVSKKKKTPSVADIASEPTKVSPSLITPVVEEPQQNMSVLLAEDNDINALLVTAALKKQNISVIRAVNGNEAIERFTQSQTDLPEDKISLILMDMHMPLRDGFSATKAIRKLEAEKSISAEKRVRIFALTADEQNDSKEKARKAGVDGFLLKPIDPVYLCELVKLELEKTNKRDKVGA